jgi:hypothetical protein
MGYDRATPSSYEHLITYGHGHDRFPEDFIFRLTREEIMRISQFVISSVHPGVKTLKFSKNVTAFTEHGVAMLSKVV